MKVIFIVFTILVSVITQPFFIAKTTDKPSNPQKVDSLKTPEEELAGFKLPEGFIMELVASERDGVINPIDITFDDAGRLWTQTAIMYPLDPVNDIKWDELIKLMDNQDARNNHPAFKRIHDLYQGKTKGLDKVLILSDLYDPKKSVKTTVWADGLAIPMSILPYKDGAYIAQGSELFFLNDANQDGKADQRTPMLTGFGYTDTHTMAHVLIRGPGDWIYFSHGALNKGEVSSLTSGAKQQINYSKIARFSMDAKKFELVSAGLNNIWGFQLRNNGQWYGSEANDLGYSVVPMEPGTGYPGIGNDRLREYQPWMPELHQFRVGGTGISGLAFSDDISGSFPQAWKDVAFLANPITSTINSVRIVRNPDGTVTAQHLPDLLVSEDKSFRPVNMEFGPDGCLYVADWYNKIISHNEISTNHPDRDKSHGRIWRIRHISQKPATVPNFNKVKTKTLVNHLKSPTLWAKRAAWHQITDRPAAETRQLIAPLIALSADKSQDEITRILALWSLEGIKHFDASLMTRILASPQHNLRREAVRSLVTFALKPAQTAALLKNLVEDTNPMIRSEVLRTLTDMGAADASTIDILVQACKPELPGNEMGGSYERKFERYLALKALEQYPDELYLYMKNRKADQTLTTHLLWASQALPKTQKEEMFLEIWPVANKSELDESNFILIAKMLNNQKIYQIMKPVMGNPVHATKYVGIALKNQQQTQSTELSSILASSVNSLLKSKVESDRQLALDAIGRLKINVPLDVIPNLLNNQASETTIKLALKALENNPKANKDVLEQLLRNDKLDFDLRISALEILSRAEVASASQMLQQWIPKFDRDQKRNLVNVLSGSNQGSIWLINLYDKHLIDLDAFNLSAAERVFNSANNSPGGSAILTGVKKRDEEEKQVWNNRLSKYMAIAEKKGGDPKKGMISFQTCLMCHRVGDQGQGIAPALDGSAARENEALLTAILDPDAAVEGGYALYRVIKKDNTMIEGYLSRKEDSGTTIAFMGGNTIFIQTADIKSQGFLGGRSFMPKGLIDHYTDDQVADLLAYIRTIK